MKTLRIFALLCFILGFNSRVNAQNFQFKFDIPFSMDVPCLSDVLTGTLTYHGVYLVKDDGLFFYKDQFHAELTGLSGEVYRFVNHWWEQKQVEVSNGSYIEKGIVFLNLVGRGGDYWHFKYSYHLTVKPDGEIIVDNEKMTDECD